MHVTQVSKEFYFDQITRLSNVKQEAWLYIYKNLNFCCLTQPAKLFNILFDFFSFASTKQNKKHNVEISLHSNRVQLIEQTFVVFSRGIFFYSS